MSSGSVWVRKSNTVTTVLPNRLVFSRIRRRANKYWGSSRQAKVHRVSHCSDLVDTTVKNHLVWAYESVVDTYSTKKLNKIHVVDIGTNSSSLT